jgi:serine/threonine-protein kinase RsbW
MVTYQFPSRLEYLRKCIETVTLFANSSGVSKDKIVELELALEEAFVNIFKYAYPDATNGMVEITGNETDKDKIKIEIRDNGIPFNALSHPEPNISVPLLERKIGGLGIYLIKKTIDEIYYRREEGRNILTFVISKRN